MSELVPAAVELGGGGWWLLTKYSSRTSNFRLPFFIPSSSSLVMACTFSSLRSYLVWVNDDSAHDATTIVVKNGSPNVRKGDRRSVLDNPDLDHPQQQRRSG